MVNREQSRSEDTGPRHLRRLADRDSGHRCPVCSTGENVEGWDEAGASGHVRQSRLLPMVHGL